MTHPSDRFPDDMRQHLVDAFADYLDAFKACAQSDGADLVALLHQLIEASAAVNRAMRVGPILLRAIECAVGSTTGATGRPERSRGRSPVSGRPGALGDAGMADHQPGSFFKPSWAAIRCSTRCTMTGSRSGRRPSPVLPAGGA